MPMRAVLDSNFIIALIVEDDENHLDALSTWKHVDAAYLPVIAASEIAYFLLRHHIDLSVLSEVLRDPRIEVVENGLEDLLFAVKRKHMVKSYDDFNDMLILSTALRLKAKLLTYDKPLKRLYESMVR